nr:Unknown Function [uncultured bacterium]
MTTQAAGRGFNLMDPAFRELVVRRLTLLAGLLLTGGLFIFPRVPLLVAIAGGAFFLNGPTLGFRREMLPVYALLFVILGVSLIGGGGVDIGDLAIRYANFAAGLILLGLYLKLPRNTLAEDMYFFGKIFSIQAVLTVLFAELGNRFFSSISADGELEYRTLGLFFTYHVMLEDSTRFLRPDGFFYEPAVFQIFLNLQLYLALFIFKDRKWGAAALMGVLATQSTTALIVAFGLIGFYYIRLLPTASAFEKIAGLVIAPVLAIPLVIIAAQNFESKFQGVAVGSKWAREFDAYTGLSIVAEYPLTGIGFSRERYSEMAMKHGYMVSELSDENLATRVRGNSNGIVMVLFTMGIPLALVFFYGLFRQRFFPHKYIVAAVVFTSLLPEPLALNPFFLMLTFSGLLYVPRREASVRMPQRQRRPLALPRPLPN